MSQLITELGVKYGIKHLRNKWFRLPLFFKFHLFTYDRSISIGLRKETKTVMPHEFILLNMCV